MNSCIVELPTTDLKAAPTALEEPGFKTAWLLENYFANIYGDGNIEVYLRQ
jgi:hypothetical protein